MDSKRFQELVEESTYNHGSFADLFTCGVCDMKMWADNIHEHLQSHVSVCTNYQFNQETKTIIPVFENTSSTSQLGQKRKLPVASPPNKAKICVTSPRSSMCTSVPQSDTPLYDRGQRSDSDIENYMNSDRLSMIMDYMPSPDQGPAYFAARPYQSKHKDTMTDDTPRSFVKPKDTKKKSKKDKTNKTVAKTHSQTAALDSSITTEGQALTVGETITKIDIPYVFEGKELGTYHCSVIVDSFSPKCKQSLLERDSDGKFIKGLKKALDFSNDEADETDLDQDISDNDDTEFTAIPLRPNELQNAVDSITGVMSSPSKTSQQSETSQKKKKRKKKGKKAVIEISKTVFGRKSTGRHFMRKSCKACLWTEENISILIESELKKDMKNLCEESTSLEMYFADITVIEDFSIYTWVLQDLEKDTVRKDVGTEIVEQGLKDIFNSNKIYEFEVKEEPLSDMELEQTESLETQFELKGAADMLHDDAVNLDNEKTVVTVEEIPFDSANNETEMETITLEITEMPFDSDKNGVEMETTSLENVNEKELNEYSPVSDMMIRDNESLEVNKINESSNVNESEVLGQNREKQRSTADGQTKLNTFEVTPTADGQTELSMVKVTSTADGQTKLNTVEVTSTADGQTELKEVKGTATADGQTELNEVKLSITVDGPKGFSEDSIGSTTEVQKVAHEVKLCVTVENPTDLDDVILSSAADAKELKIKGVKECSTANDTEVSKVQKIPDVNGVKGGPVKDVKKGLQETEIKQNSNPPTDMMVNNVGQCLINIAPPANVVNYPLFSFNPYQTFMNNQFVYVPQPTPNLVYQVPLVQTINNTSVEQNQASAKESNQTENKKMVTHNSIDVGKNSSETETGKAHESEKYCTVSGEISGKMIEKEDGTHVSDDISTISEEKLDVQGLATRSLQSNEIELDTENVIKQRGILKKTDIKAKGKVKDVVLCNSGVEAQPKYNLRPERTSKIMHMLKKRTRAERKSQMSNPADRVMSDVNEDTTKKNDGPVEKAEVEQIDEKSEESNIETNLSNDNKHEAKGKVKQRQNSASLNVTKTEKEIKVAKPSGKEVVIVHETKGRTHELGHGNRKYENKGKMDMKLRSCSVKLFRMKTKTKGSTSKATDKEDLFVESKTGECGKVIKENAHDQQVCLTVQSDHDYAIAEQSENKSKVVPSLVVNTTVTQSTPVMTRRSVSQVNSANIITLTDVLIHPALTQSIPTLATQSASQVNVANNIKVVPSSVVNTSVTQSTQEEKAASSVANATVSQSTQDGKVASSVVNTTITHSTADKKAASSIGNTSGIESTPTTSTQSVPQLIGNNNIFIPFGNQLVNLQQPIIPMQQQIMSPFQPMMQFPTQQNVLPFLNQNTLVQQNAFSYIPQQNLVTANAPQFVIPSFQPTVPMSTVMQTVGNMPLTMQSQQATASQLLNTGSGLIYNPLVNFGTNMMEKNDGKTDKGKKKMAGHVKGVNSDGVIDCNFSTPEQCFLNLGGTPKMPRVEKVMNIFNYKSKEEKKKTIKTETDDSFADDVNSNKEGTDVSQEEKEAVSEVKKETVECKLCEEVIETEEQWGQHVKDNHSHKEVVDYYLDNCLHFVCCGCGNFSTTLSRFQEHASKCQLATKYEFNKFDMSLYDYQVRFKARWPCPFCHQSLMNKSQLIEHKKTCESKQHIICNMCTFETHSKAAFSVHNAKVHQKSKIIYKCKICDRKYNMLLHLENHIRFKHEMKTVLPKKKKERSGKQETVCEICGKVLFNYSLYLLHKRIHTSRHQCVYCGLTLHNGLANSIHEGNHTGDFRFSCTVCRKVFPSSIGYAEHMKKDHKIESKEAMNLNKNLRRIRGLLFTYSCIKCKESFHNDVLFLKHMLEVHDIAEDKARRKRLITLTEKKREFYYQRVEIGELVEIGLQVVTMKDEGLETVKEFEGQMY